MRTKRNKSLLAVSVIIIISVIVVGFSGSIQGSQRRYDIRPEITLPEYRTDTARAIDAYERIMDRFISMTERNMVSIDTDVRSITEKLAMMDGKLTDLSTRMVMIEKALGILPVEKAIEKTPVAVSTTEVKKD